MHSVLPESCWCTMRVRSIYIEITPDRIRYISLNILLWSDILITIYDKYMAFVSAQRFGRTAAHHDAYRAMCEAWPCRIRNVYRAGPTPALLRLSRQPKPGSPWPGVTDRLRGRHLRRPHQSRRSTHRAGSAAHALYSRSIYRGARVTYGDGATRASTRRRGWILATVSPSRYRPSARPPRHGHRLWRPAPKRARLAA